MDISGGKASECWQPAAEGYHLLGPGDCISCQAVSRLYPWAASNHGFLVSGTVYRCQECHNLRATPLRRCTAHHAWIVSLWSIWETDQNEPEQCTKNIAHQRFMISQLSWEPEWLSGTVYSGTSWNMSSLDLGSALDKEPTWDYAQAEHQATLAWEEQEMHGSTGTGHS